MVKSSGKLLFYAGAKEYSRLSTIGLSDTIDFGTLRLIVKPLFIFMYWIYEHLHSWVFSIVALTLIVRLFMFPLTYKSTVAMGKMAELAPKMQELKEKYKNDPVKFQEEMMKLYQEVGFNPMSGCLPIFSRKGQNLTHKITHTSKPAGYSIQFILRVRPIFQLKG